MTKPTAGADSTVFEPGALKIARTYAQASLNLIAEAADPEAILSEFDEIQKDLWQNQPEFAAYLSSPFVHPAQRDEVLSEILDGRAHPILVHLLRVLNRRGRLSLLPVVNQEVHRLWNIRMKRVEVQVRSAVALDSHQLDDLKTKIQALLPGQTPVLEASVDPELLGGLVIQVGDRVFDASVRTNLKVLRERLIAKRYREIRDRREQLSTAS